MTSQMQHPIFGTDEDCPVNDFMAIADTPQTGRSCSDYLAARFARDHDPRVSVLLPRRGRGFAATLRRKGELPPRARVATISVLSRRGVQAFARLWLMSRPEAMSNKLYRRFANRLAVFSMPPLGKRFAEALDVLVYLKDGRPDRANAVAQRVWDLTAVNAPHLTSLARAMVAATQEDPYRSRRPRGSR